MFELRETGDWDIFLGPPKRARAETRGTDQWVLKRREYSGFARVNQVTFASLRYPLSVFNKNSTLKGTHTHTGQQNKVTHTVTPGTVTIPQHRFNNETKEHTHKQWSTDESVLSDTVATSAHGHH